MRRDDPVLHLMRLIWAVDHELQSVSKRMETTIGLTVPQRMTLLLLAHQPGILAGEIADVLHLHAGTVSGIIGRLEAAGFLERTGDEADARRMRLTLTEPGRAANAQRTGTFEGAVRRVLEESSEEERAAAERLLTRLATALRATAEHHTARAARASRS